MAPSPVSLFIYDLSNGLARQLSVALTGAFFPAIYHTGVVIFNREYFFGGNGIQSSAPGASPYGTPIERRALGNTTVTPQAWNEFLRECNSQFGIGAYHLLTNNCNTFSDAACQFLVNTPLERAILDQPSQFLATPFGQMMRPQLDSYYATTDPVGSTTGRVNGTSPLETIGRAAAAVATAQAQAQAASGAPVPPPASVMDRGAAAEDAAEHTHPIRFSAQTHLSAIVARVKSQCASRHVALPEPDWLEALQRFIESETAPSDHPATLPHLAGLNAFIDAYLGQVDADDVYPFLDLLRLLVLDPRVAAYVAEHPQGLERIAALALPETEGAQATRQKRSELFANALTFPLLRPRVTQLIYADAEAVTHGVLSATPRARRAAVAALHNAVTQTPPPRTSGVGLAAVAALHQVLSDEATAAGLAEDERRQITTTIQAIVDTAEPHSEVAELAEVMGYTPSPKASAPSKSTSVPSVSAVLP